MQWVLLACGIGPLCAQPFIYYRGITNAASFEGPGLPGGSIAQGSIFTIFGSNIGPAQPVQNASFPLPNTLGGVSISVVQNTATLAAIPIFVASTQVSAIMPSTTPLGQVVIRLSYNNQTSNPAYVNVVPASPGLFSLASSGFGPGVVQNFISSADEPVNSMQTTALPGQTLVLWATGLGPVPYADNIAPTAETLPTKIEVFVGNQSAAVAYSGRSPCCSGLDEIVFTVPTSVPAGCYVPVQVRANAAVVSNAVTIAVDPKGAACSDSFNPSAATLRAGGADGFIAPHRFDFLVDENVSTPVDTIDDFLDVIFANSPGGATFFNPAMSLPPVGTCTMYSASAFAGPDALAFFAPQAQALDAGPELTATSGSATASLAPRPDYPLSYGAVIGQQSSALGTSALFYNFPGSFDLAIPGGANVTNANVQVNTNTDTPLEWTNRSSLVSFTRSSGLTVTWTGGDPVNGAVIVGVVSNNDAANSSGVALCVAPVSAGTFSLPLEVLGSLPATPSSATRIGGWVAVMSVQIQNPGQFSAPGLTSGIVTPAYAAVKSVIVQ